MAQLIDADTATPIGEATREQVRASLQAGETGIFLIDENGDVIDAQTASDTGLRLVTRRVFVQL